MKQPSPVKAEGNLRPHGETNQRHIELGSPPDQVLGSRTQGHYTNDPSLGVVLIIIIYKNNICKTEVNMPMHKGISTQFFVH